MSKHNIRVTASLTVNQSVISLGAFKTFTGGGYTSGKRKSVRAAGEKEIARGGRPQTEDVTIGREYDGQPTIAWLKDHRNAPMTITRQPLDDDLNPLGNPDVYTGLLNEVHGGDADAESTDELNDFTLVMLVNG